MAHAQPGESCSEVNLRLIESGYATKHNSRERTNIAAFVLADGSRILVKQQDDGAARDLAHALRMTACGYFTTSLARGPTQPTKPTSTSTLACTA